MSEGASSAFVPFDAGAPASAGTASPAAILKVLPKTEAGSAFEPLQTSPKAHSHGAGKPVVTLQREGERVTGIRIECACGQVLELECSY
jgi:hypothetical protein